ncbi:hypothetical protein Aca07nite_04860 [Actinoplanes capillaceus]|uniref:Tetratricopeptide repeat-containing protein n=1 Tax=Actinoplanes campanulatus TaxID=113559 RepID=A0ABQ3WBI7_9ACTN|nr:tetratricopeptide repeat protein [Actinoplanes capillaceus]GID43211.1 hypothetical protein Aca07nite_04860 [Actinoplanes capillaceus]
MPAPLEPDTTPEEHRERALLLADLGRYDEAADEIAAGLTAAPQEAGLLATLARIHLAADQPAEALAAAERAAAAEPGDLAVLVVRSMALTDSRRFADAAGVAAEILTGWPDDAYAQRTGAALLSESRNGQEALNAAWNGVRIAPTDAEAHLVLAVVAARLRLFDLAQRAYGEALELDPVIGDAGRDTGIVRFERRRWARAIEELAEEASLGVPPGADIPDPGAFASPSPPVVVPAHPVLDVSGETADAVGETARYGSGGTIVAAVLAAAMTLINVGISRVWAGLIGVLIFGAVVFWFRGRLPEPAGVVMRRLRSGDRRLAAAVYLTFAAPLFLLGYAVVGGPAPLVAGMVAGAVAEVLVLADRRRR